MKAPRSLIIIGGGEHACVIAEAARSRPDLWNIAGFVDARPSEAAVKQLAARQIASDEEGIAIAQESWFVIGIGSCGSNKLRRQLVARYTDAGARWAVVIHSQAWLSPSATICPGAVVLAGAVVNTGAMIGAHCVVNTGAIIEHNVKLGDFTMAAPGAILGGGVEVEEDCYLGLGCRIRDHIRVGYGSVIGMGAVVIMAVAAGEVVAGVPARPLAGASKVPGN